MLGKDTRMPTNSMEHLNPTPPNGRHTRGGRLRHIFICGGGPAGLTTASELAIQARRMGINLVIYVYESSAYGGGRGRWVATVASHAWEHRDGAFYVEGQPEVTISLQQSTQRLRELVPYAFTDPLAFTIDLDGDLPAFFKPLGVWYQPVTASVARHWLTKLRIRLPAGARLVRVRDAIIDTRLLGYGLMHT